jgi:hypothetical protein
MNKENQEKNLTLSVSLATGSSGVLISSTPSLSVQVYGAEINMATTQREKQWGVMETTESGIRAISLHKTREEAVKIAVELNSSVIDSSFFVQEVVVSA